MSENLPHSSLPEMHDAVSPIVVETDRTGLVLVQMLTEDDDREYFEFQNRNKEYFAEYGNSIYDTPEEVTQSRLEKNKVRFGIRLNGTLIGMEGYTPSEDGLEAEVGVMLAQDAAGHGYASSALKAMTAYMVPRFDRIFAEADPNNDRSLRLCERTGYVRKGTVIRDWGPAVVLDFEK